MFVSDRAGGRGGRDVYLYDLAIGKFLPLPGLNDVGQEQSPAISTDGRFLAFVSERLGTQGERDIFLYDRAVGKLLPLSDVNSPGDEMDPCVVLLGTP